MKRARRIEVFTQMVDRDLANTLRASEIQRYMKLLFALPIELANKVFMYMGLRILPYPLDTSNPMRLTWSGYNTTLGWSGSNVYRPTHSLLTRPVRIRRSLIEALRLVTNLDDE